LDGLLLPMHLIEYMTKNPQTRNDLLHTTTLVYQDVDEKHNYFS